MQKITKDGHKMRNDEMENYYWKAFQSTGSVEEYLKFKNVSMQQYNEGKNADNHNGDSSQRS